MSPPLKSPVWAFFAKTVDKKYAICRLCNTHLKYFMSTTNLKHHLTRKHPIEFEEHNKGDYVVENLELVEADIETESGEVTKRESGLYDSSEIVDTRPDLRKLKRARRPNEDTVTSFVVRRPVLPQKKSVDEFQIFSDFVASELRSLRSKENQNKLKRMIQRSILEMSEIDDNDSASASTSEFLIYNNSKPSDEY